MARGGRAEGLRIGLGVAGEGGAIPMDDGKGSRVPAFPSSPQYLQGLGQALSVSQALCQLPSLPCFPTAGERDCGQVPSAPLPRPLPLAPFRATARILCLL